MKASYYMVETLIELVREQHSDRNDIISALNNLHIIGFPRQAYKQFISAENPNRPGSEWQFKENIVLEDKIDGTIVLDVLEDGRIGGVEMVSYIRY